MAETQVVNFHDDVDEDYEDEVNGNNLERKPIAKLTWKGEDFDLYEGDNLIGRDKACEVMLDHKSISGKHAEITVSRDGIAVIRDLRSANGTFVENPIGSNQYQRLTISHNRRELLNGMKVRVGMVCCEFSVLDSIDDSGDGVHAETQMLPGIGAAMETQFLPYFDQDNESSMASFHTAMAIPQGEIINPVTISSTSAVRFDIQPAAKSNIAQAVNVPMYPPEVATMVDNATQLLDIVPANSVPMPPPALTTPAHSIASPITTNANIAGVRAIKVTERITVSASTRVATQSTHGSDVPTQMDLELIRHTRQIQNELVSKEEEDVENQPHPKEVLSPYDSLDGEDDEEQSQDIMQVEEDENDAGINGAGEWVPSKNEHPFTEIPSRNNNNNDHKQGFLPARTLVDADTMDADTDDEQTTSPAKAECDSHSTNTFIDPPVIATAIEDQNTYISTAVNSAQVSPEKSVRSCVINESNTAVPTPDIADCPQQSISVSSIPAINPIVTSVGIDHTANDDTTHPTDKPQTGDVFIQPDEKDWLCVTTTAKKKNKRNVKEENNDANNSSSSSTDGGIGRSSRRTSRTSASKVAVTEDVPVTLKRKLCTIEEGIYLSDQEEPMEDEFHSKKPKHQPKEISVEEPAPTIAINPGRSTRKRNAASMNKEEEGSATIKTQDNNKKSAKEVEETGNKEEETIVAELFDPTTINSVDDATVSAAITVGRHRARKCPQAHDVPKDYRIDVTTVISSNSADNNHLISSNINNSSSSTDVVTNAKGSGGRKKLASTEEIVPKYQPKDLIGDDLELTLEDEPIYLMFTKLEESAFQRYLRRLPQIIVTNDPRLATHILTTPELKRTPKLLVALNHRVRYIVTEEWLRDSAKLQIPISLIPTSISTNTGDDSISNNPIQRKINAYSLALQQCKYVVHDEEKETLWHFHLVDTLARIRFIPTEERQIFQHIAFYITDGLFGKTAPSQAETKSIVESAGGVLLDDTTHSLLSNGHFWQERENHTKEEDVEETAIPAKRRRKSAIDTNDFVTDKKRKKEVGGESSNEEVQIAVDQCHGRKLVVISHPTVVKKCITKDVVQRLKQHIEPARDTTAIGRTVAPGVYSIEVLYEAVLRQELDLQVHKLDGYDFSR